MGILKASLIGAGLTALMASGVAAEMRMSLSHVANTDHPIHAAAETFARVAGDLSDGEINVRIFPNSQLGKAKEALEGLQLGTIDITLDSIGALSSFHPVAGVESMPYLFEGPEHYIAVWNSPTGQEIKDLLAEEANFRVMGHLYRGSRELTANRPINSIDELEGLKIRVTPIKERLETWKAFGANPTPMPWSEVFTALQQGVIDAQENPIAAIHAQKIHEVQDYLILTSHMANGWTFVMNAERFDGLPKTLQIALRGAAEAATIQFQAYVQANRDRLIEALKAEGMTVIEIDQGPFREKAKEVVALFPELQPYYERMIAE
ncbi:MAG: TRAP transporter substrate-binding protein [Pseudomonadota bacterium]